MQPARRALPGGRRPRSVVPIVFMLTLAVQTGAAVPSAGASAMRASDAAWTRAVCSGVSSWLGSVRSAASRTSTTGADVKKVRQSLGTLLKSSDGATTKLLKALKGAGTPTSGGGKLLAPIVQEQLARVRQAIVTARTALPAASTSDRASFDQAAVAAQDGLESALEAIQAALGAATMGDEQPLLGAFTGNDRCRAAIESPATGGLTVVPSTVSPGRDITVTPSGVDAEAMTVCTQSSALKTELLGSDGARIAIGGRSLAVPADAKVGDATVRLVCYLPDQTGRRVIRGLCGPITLGTGTTVADSSTACPATPRLVFAQGVVLAESALSAGFNSIVS